MVSVSYSCPLHILEEVPTASYIFVTVLLSDLMTLVLITLFPMYVLLFGL